MKNRILFLMAIWPLVGAGLPAESTYKLAQRYTVTIHGTLSIRDWVETVGEVTGEMKAGSHAGGGTDLNSIRITMIVRSIRSDMGKTMDNNTYKALKAEADPEITFRLGAPVTVTAAGGRRQPIALAGQLTLAGVTRPTTLWINELSIGPDSMRFVGEQSIKMTDFGVKPPSALFGTLRVGPVLTINFITVFTIQPK
jgi:polyisoprenoid-binding protein YceI